MLVVQFTLLIVEVLTMVGFNMTTLIEDLMLVLLKALVFQYFLMEIHYSLELVLRCITTFSQIQEAVEMRDILDSELTVHQQINQ